MSDDGRRAGELADEILDLLERDSVSAALAVVQDPEALALARTEPVLQEAALGAVCAALWTCEPEARVIYARLVHPGVEPARLALWFEMNFILIGWKVFVGIPRPPLLTRVMRTARVVRPAARARMIGDLYDAVRREPAAYLAAFDQIRKAGAEMIAHVTACIGRAGLPEPPIDDLPEATRDRVIEAARRIDRGLAYPREVVRFWVLIGVLAGGAVVTLLLAGTAFVPGVGGAIGIYFLWNYAKDRVYRRLVQPEMIELALQHGLTNRPLGYWVESRPQRYPRLSRHADRLSGDAVLYLFAVLWASQQPEQQAGDAEPAAASAAPPAHDLPEIDPYEQRRPRTPEEISRERWQTLYLVLALVAGFTALGLGTWWLVTR